MRSSSVVFAVLSLFHASCAAEAGSVEPVADPVVFTNARLAGGASTDLGVRGGVVVPVSSLADAPRVDLQGRFVVPAFIDTHVHVVYLPRGKELVAGGIAGVVDLAAPEARLDQPDGPSGLMSRLMRLEASFSVVPAVPGIPERLTALEAVADSWGI